MTLYSSSRVYCLIFILVGIGSVVFLGSAEMYFAKLPIIILLARVFAIQKYVRYTIYFIMMFAPVAFFVVAMWTGINCCRGLHVTYGHWLLNCIEAIFYTLASRNCLSLAVDCVIFVLPLPSIIQMHLPLRQKFGAVAESGTIGSSL